MSAAVEAPVQRGRRPDVEKELADKYHVKFKYHEAVALDRFDKKRSLQNQARFESLNEETVAQYAEAIKRGDDFPAVIAYRQSAGGKLIIVDGNHRLEGHDKAGADDIACYELDRETDKRTIALLTYSMNTRHGRPTSPEERVHQAIFLIEAGASQEAAASAVNLDVRVLKRSLAARAADMRADEVGLKRTEWEAIPQSAKNRLLAVKTDEGFRAAAELAFQAKLQATEVFDLVQLLNVSGSSVKQLAAVKNQRDVYQDRIQASAGGTLGSADRRAQTPRQRVATALGMVGAIPDAFDTIVSGYPVADRKEVADNLQRASQRLGELAKAMRKK